MARHAGLAAAAAAAGIAALWLGFGAAAGDIALWAAYEAAFVVLPGVVALRALAPRLCDVLTTVAVGWALGYALELAAFALTGALELRELFPLHPLLVVAIAAPVAWRRRRPGDAARLAPAAAWAIAGAVLLASLYVAGGYFTISPEPGGSRTVAYFPDFAFHISLAAEAKHHWPVGEPSVGGRELRYHTFVHMHMAAASKVTGIELSTILFRLLPLTLIALVALQMAAIGRRVGGGAVAALAPVLALCAGELDLDPARFAPFAGHLLRSLFLSPSMLFGLVLLLPIAALAVDRMRERHSPGLGEAAVLLLLMAAAAGAKAALLPLIVAAAGFALLWCGIFERRLHRAAASLLAMATAVFAGTYALLYRGGGEGGLEPGLLAMFDSTVVGETLRQPADGLAGAAVWAIAAPVSVALLFLPLAGAAWVLAERGRSLGAARAFLAGLFLAGLALALVLRHPAGAQLYFAFYGYLAALPLAAEGFVSAWRRWEPVLRAERRWLALAAAAVLVTGLAASELVRAIEPATGVGYALMYGPLAAVVATAAVLTARRAERAAWPLAAAVATALVVVATALDAPIDWVREPAARAATGKPLYAADKSERSHGLDPHLLDGLRWIRANTDEDAVLAVNNHWADTANTYSVFAYYSAFAERRVYLESWLYARESFELGYERARLGALPFPGRLALNDGAFQQPELLARLRDEGVTHLVVDKQNGPRAPAADTLAPALYSNPSIAVYALR